MCACGHAPRVSLFNHQGIPLWGSLYQGPGGSPGSQALRGVVHISEAWMCAHEFRCWVLLTIPGLWGD